MKPVHENRLNRCHVCGSPRLVDVFEKIARQVGGVRFVDSVSAQRCDACSAVTLDGPAVLAFEDGIVRWLVENAARWPPSVRTLRRAAGLSVDGLAERLGVDARTAAAWESGHAPEILPAQFEALGQLALEAVAATPRAPGSAGRFSETPPAAETLVDFQTTRTT